MTTLSDAFSLSLHLQGGELDETDHPDAPPARIDCPRYECGICAQVHEQAIPHDDTVLLCSGCRQPLEFADFAPRTLVP